ncbi:hypothetical protein [Limosilactobacillus difficilis]|uniref:hypothetical protein n=1 Tax=Limosilactobacillus difficilis TaxID=2991838 RepID=UPI0024BAAF09|nr:hypothetical protein [Limosilactobacillus difficilis]
MSIEIPANMDEVAMKIAQAQVHGQKLTTEEVIRDAVKDTMQALMDEALAGHYDDVSWDGSDLVVTDFTGKTVGRVSPNAKDFTQEFRDSADKLSFRLAKAAKKIVGGR